MEKPNWTCSKRGSNSSKAFLRIVAEVERMLRDHRIGDDPNGTARLIVAQLAHTHGLQPAAPTVEAKP